MRGQEFAETGNDLQAGEGDCESAPNNGSDSHLMILHGGVALVCQENPRHG
jgi:hypothetical protein